AYRRSGGRSGPAAPEPGRARARGGPSPIPSRRAAFAVDARGWPAGAAGQGRGGSRKTQDRAAFPLPSPMSDTRRPNADRGRSVRMTLEEASKGRVLLVDDDPALLQAQA